MKLGCCVSDPTTRNPPAKLQQCQIPLVLVMPHCTSHVTDISYIQPTDTTRTTAVYNKADPSRGQYITSSPFSLLHILLWSGLLPFCLVNTNIFLSMFLQLRLCVCPLLLVVVCSFHLIFSGFGCVHSFSLLCVLCVFHPFMLCVGDFYG